MRTPPPYFPRRNRVDKISQERGVLSEGLRGTVGTPHVQVSSSWRSMPYAALSKLCYPFMGERLLQPRNTAYLILASVFFMLASASLMSNSSFSTSFQQPQLKQLFERSHDSLRHISSQPLAAGNQSLSNDASQFGELGSPSNGSSWQPSTKPGLASSSHRVGPSGEPPRIVLLVTNQGFVDFTENLLRSMKKADSHLNVTIITEDLVSFNNLSIHQPGVHVMKAPDLKSMPEKQDAFDYNSKGYKQLINRRPAYVLDFLQKGFEVFFVDSDSYWFKDPFPYLQGDFDVAFAKDYYNALNAGIGFYKPTKAAIEFLKRWTQTMAINAKRKILKIDQIVMNGILHSKQMRARGLRVRQLTHENFPCARYYLKTQKCDNYTAETVLLHAAYLAGHELKKKMFEQCQLWLL
ncbi:UDP-D-xylose:L-fucose alpha-1,3-D-xylosyltransferase 1-like [Acanthaster planci]|uniref:UDP-D-xylose:L-fucose alpha-1,3-D-xylosyltransferase 1-like n=1 Tax=Acanthaster planci TaxID=133434 RepID=A0A8B7XG13_ACAPL|nr:UDP-D-xylose:L-fucose alpha-1,3-D-xylosyltransferase 1-like [Acanthaster planci]